MKANERVVVIGGGSGMGLAVAKKLALEGAEVVIAGRSEERLRAARAALGGSRIETATVDIGDDSTPDLEYVQTRCATFPRIVVRSEVSLS